MNRQMEHLDANRDAPEAAGQEGDVEEGGAREAEQDRRERVEEREDERVAREVSADFGVPVCGAEGGAVEDAGLGAVDQHAPESELPDDFVQRAFRDEPFFEDVAQAVE